MDDLQPLLAELLANGKITIVGADSAYQITLSSITTVNSSFHPKIANTYCNAEYDIRTKNNVEVMTFTADGTPINCAYKVLQHVIELTKPS